MKLIIDIPNSLYANLQKIQNGSIAAKRILQCVKEGVKVNKKHIEYERFIPCTCGCNMRHTYYQTKQNNKGHIIILECKRCGRTVSGKNHLDAKHNWNIAISKIQKIPKSVDILN